MGKVLLIAFLFVSLAAAVDCGLNKCIIVGRQSEGLRCSAHDYSISLTSRPWRESDSTTFRTAS